jgi:hypothetical protein
VRGGELLHEDRSRQVPDGRYRKNVALYYELLRAGKHRHEQAWAQAFAGIDLAALEEEWRKYVFTMDGGKYFGFKAQDLSSEDAERLRLQSGQGGIASTRSRPAASPTRPASRWGT